MKITIKIESCMIEITSDEPGQGESPVDDIADALAEINLQKLAKESGIPRRTLYHVRDRTHKPTARTLARIAAALESRKGAK